MHALEVKELMECLANHPVPINPETTYILPNKCFFFQQKQFGCKMENVCTHRYISLVRLHYYLFQFFSFPLTLLISSLPSLNGNFLHYG